MQYRHEVKHEISYSDLLSLRQRLKAVMKPDVHAVNGSTVIRSLYFDNITDEALKDKINGVGKREKFRLRYYNDDLSFIRLEKKSKINNLCVKQSSVLTCEETLSIINGDIGFLKDSKNRLCTEFYSKLKSGGLRPKAVVEYRREPYTFPVSNVRVTIDYDIRTGMKSSEFLNPSGVTIPVPDNPVILEVKWDNFLPDIIKEAVALKNRRSGAYSKYAASRSYN